MIQGDRPECLVLRWSKIPILGERAVAEEMDNIRELVEVPSDDENPNSAKVIKGEITAVLSAEEYSCCISCKAKVQPFSATIGECLKYNAKL